MKCQHNLVSMTTRIIDLFQATRAAMLARGQDKGISDNELSFSHNGCFVYLIIEGDELLLVDQSPANEDDDKAITALSQLTGLQIPPDLSASYDEYEREVVYYVPRTITTVTGPTQQHLTNLELAYDLVETVLRDLANQRHDDQDLINRLDATRHQPGFIQELIKGQQANPPTENSG